MTGNSLRVSIIGGGISGVAALHALLKNTSLDVHVFESAPAFREAGQAIGLGQNAISALELLGLRERLTAAQAVRTNGSRLMIAEGKDTGKMGNIKENSGEGTWIVQRSLFLAELLKDVDESRLHPGKKMKNLTQTEKEIVLEFEDGSTNTCDILLGADGIYSTVRKYVVGHDPSASPVFAGWQTVWTVVPFDAAERYLGRDLINTRDPAQYAWCGNNTWIMHDQLSNNTLVNCVIARRFDEDHLEWKRKTNKAELYDFVKNFEHPIGRAMVDLVTDSKEEYEMIPLQHHNPQAPRYVKDRVAIIGDAADGTTPWRGSGGGLSLEDAYILGSCFEKVNNVSDAKAALRAYEIIQKPRRSRLVMESYRTGLIVCGCDKSIGLDAEKMNDVFENSWEWIIGIDLEQQAKDALKLMDAEKDIQT